MKLSNEQLAELARSVAETADEEIDCEEMLTRAAAFIEAATGKQGDLPQSLRVVAQHPKVCPECREEMDVMLAARFGADEDCKGGGPDG